MNGRRAGYRASFEVRVAQRCYSFACWGTRTAYMTWNLVAVFARTYWYEDDHCGSLTAVDLAADWMRFNSTATRFSSMI